jgi:pantothenate kinase
MEELISDLVAKVKTLAPGKRYILGVTGYPGAGKSTISESLINGVNIRVGGEIAMIVPMDGFHLPNEVLESKGLLHLKGIPDSFDAAGFVMLLAELRKPADHTVGCPRFDRSIEASIENGIQISPHHQLLIVEGNYLLYDKEPWSQARQYLDESWFLDVSLDTIYPRLVERHIVGGKTEEQAKAKVALTDLPNARLIEGTKTRAHRLVQCEFATLKASEKS